MKTVFQTYLAIISLLIGIVDVQAEETKIISTSAPESYAPIPDFNEILDQLRTNRQLYNSLNDSLFIVTEEEPWMDLVLRRAELNFHKYGENQHLLDSVYYYFLKPEEHKDPTSSRCEVQPHISDAAYDSLWHALNWHYGLVDPFIGEILMGKILIPHISKRERDDAEHHELLAHLYLSLGECLFQISSMGDTAALRQSYDMLYESVSHATRCPEGSRGRITGIYAMSNLLSHTDVEQRVGFTDSIAASYYRLYASEIHNYRDTIQYDYLFPYYMSYLHLGANHPVLKVRSKILAETTPTEALTSEIEEVMQVAARSALMQAVKQLRDPREYYSTDRVIEARLGRISYKAAFDSCVSFYQDFLPVESASSFARSFRCLVFSCQDILYLMDHTQYPASVKEQVALQMCDKIMRLLKIRPDNQLNSQHTNLLLTIIREPRLMKHLPTDYRRRYMHRCFLALSVHTLAHYTLVAHYANAVYAAVLEQHPEALIGVLGYNTIEEVMAHQHEIHDFLYFGGKLHDVGKLSMEQVINNEFRHLTDHEFSLIKLHPELYLANTGFDPSLRAYAPMALGHHKWYDGTHGYPEWYDNTQSRERILVDILTVADCLEAATNRMSRNYRKSKPFSLVIGEFQAQAGTRYNPVVIESLLRSRERYKHLEILVQNSWKSVFKSIFLEKAMVLDALDTPDD